MTRVKCDFIAGLDFGAGIITDYQLTETAGRFILLDIRKRGVARDGRLFLSYTTPDNAKWAFDALDRASNHADIRAALDGVVAAIATPSIGGATQISVHHSPHMLPPLIRSRVMHLVHGQLRKGIDVVPCELNAEIATALDGVTGPPADIEFGRDEIAPEKFQVYYADDFLGVISANPKLKLTTAATAISQGQLAIPGDRPHDLDQLNFLPCPTSYSGLLFREKAKPEQFSLTLAAPVPPEEAPPAAAPSSPASHLPPLSAYDTPASRYKQMGLRLRLPASELILPSDPTEADAAMQARRKLYLAAQDEGTLLPSHRQKTFARLIQQATGIKMPFSLKTVLDGQISAYITAYKPLYLKMKKQSE